MGLKLFIQPSFTRFGDLNRLKQAFKRAPKQIAGSPDAFDGWVAEFEDPETKRTATCSEIFNDFKYKRFLVKMLDGRIISVVYDAGKFFIQDIQKDKRQEIHGSVSAQTTNL